jgi:arginine repressor
MADDPALLSEAKRLAKRTIEYSATTASREVKEILAQKAKAEGETKTPSRPGAP